MLLNPVQAGAIDTSAGEGIEVVIGVNTGNPASPPGGAQSPALGPPPPSSPGRNMGRAASAGAPEVLMRGDARRQQMASYLGLQKEQAARTRDIGTVITATPAT